MLFLWFQAGGDDLSKTLFLLDRQMNPHHLMFNKKRSLLNKASIFLTNACNAKRCTQALAGSLQMLIGAFLGKSGLNKHTALNRIKARPVPIELPLSLIPSA